MVSDKAIADKLAHEINSGYWEAGNHYFFNKAECLRYATSKRLFGPNDVIYHFFDEEFASLDWSREPTQSIKELCVERARQLRDKYDYIMLAFSGGIDSTAMLDAFLDNDIKIDEIVTYYPVTVIEKLLPTFNHLDKSPGNLIFEYTEAVVPKLKKIAISHPNIKITVVDYTKKLLEVVGTGAFLNTALAGLVVSPNCPGGHMICEMLREYSETRNAACVLGVDKPRIGYCPDTKRFGLRFGDMTTLWGKYDRSTFNGFQPNIEFFYYAHEFPQLIQKQSFVVKRAMMPLATATTRIPEYKKMITVPVGNYESFRMDSEMFKHILYEDYNPLVFQAEKSASLFYSETGDWFNNSDMTDSRLKDFYDGQVTEFLHGVSKGFIRYSPDGKPGLFAHYGTKIIYF